MPGTERIAVLDIQGFRAEQQFIVKELSFSILILSNIEFDVDRHYIFRPPFEWKALNRKDRQTSLWLRTHYHGFTWNSGNTNYCEIAKCFEELLKKSTHNLVIFVKGKEKIQWLKNLCNDQNLVVRNLEELGCNINFNDEAIERMQPHHCRKHEIIKQCAKQNVEFLKEWVLQNVKLME
jgi:hypothetical protein